MARRLPLSRDQTERHARPYFSIVIPTLNEEQFLPNLLKDLARQTFSSFEVIHVDGKSEDQTVAVARMFAKRFPLQQLICPVRNVSTQRNVGAAKARGQWLLFLDADSRISLHFLKKLSFGLQQKDPDVFTCLLRVHSTKKEELALAKIVNYATLIYSKFRPISMGACMGAKKEVWKLLRFDESLKVMEDYDFSIRAVKKGLSFVVFQQPKYVYSLRRMRKVGITQHALMSVISVINSATDGLLFNELPEYPMLGGTPYRKK